MSYSLQPTSVGKLESKNDQNVRFEHPIVRTGKEEKADGPSAPKAQDVPTSVKITKVVRPCITDIIKPAGKVVELQKPEATDKASEALLTALQTSIEGFEKKFDGTKVLSDLHIIHPSTMALDVEGKEAVKATTQVLEELTKGNYPLHSAESYARTSANLLWNHLFGGATNQKQKVDAVYAQVIDGNSIVVTQRDPKECNHPTLVVSDKNTQMRL